MVHLVIRLNGQAKKKKNQVAKTFSRQAMAGDMPLRTGGLSITPSLVVLKVGQIILDGGIGP